MTQDQFRNLHPLTFGTDVWKDITILTFKGKKIVRIMWRLELVCTLHNKLEAQAKTQH